MMAPEIGTVTPDTGTEGEAIEIVGNFFSTMKPKVYLGQKKCTVRSWGMNKIAFEVPKKMDPGLYAVTISNRVGSDTLVDGFTIIIP